MRFIYFFSFSAAKFSLFAIALLLLISAAAFGQDKCLTDEQTAKIAAAVKARQNGAFSQQLQDQLLRIKSETALVYSERDKFNAVPSVASEERLNRQNEANTIALCQILRESGWVGKERVGAEAGDVVYSVFMDTPSFAVQKQLLPILEEAFQTGEMAKSRYAKMVDLMLVRAGKQQIFGTAVGTSKDLILLYPITDEANVAARRSQFELPPLDEQIRHLEQRFQFVVVKAPTAPAAAPETKAPDNNPAPNTPNAPDANESEEVIRISTKLVNLNATVLPDKTGVLLPPLTKDDFTVFENNVAQPIEWFAAAQVGFDITLLIDVSGSTAGKTKLLRKTTRNFIKAARASDRISIIIFDDRNTVIAPLTNDKNLLLKSVDKIESGGGSKVWDALEFALRQTKNAADSAAPNQERRSAIVFMTDGADNGFINDLDASEILFADLLENVRRGETLIVPIHLDTREDYGLTQKRYIGTRRALNLLADESGGLFYEARKIDDLDNVYTQVINDLSKVYSLAYSPADASRVGEWRSFKVALKKYPNLIVRSRKGYYNR